MSLWDAIKTYEFKKRKEIIVKLGEELNLFPIQYYTFNGMITFSDFRAFTAILKKNNLMSKNVGLILETFGGSGEAASKFVKMIRQYITPANEFNVIVLKHALSAGTLLCLGADNIYI